MAGFYLGDTRDYDTRALEKATKLNLITQTDADLIRSYIGEKVACNHISRNRVLKICTTLLGWRKTLIFNEYQSLTTAELFSAIQSLGSCINQASRPMAKNTQHDYVVILKPFLFWLLEGGFNSSLNEKKIRSIRAPPKNIDTTHPEDILHPDEITRIIGACRKIRDRALISVHYEAATRIGEIGRLTWKDCMFDDYGARILIHDTKTKKTRSARITNSISARYLAQWKADYPGTPEGDATVFLSERGGGISYYAILKIIKEAAIRAEVKKRIGTHLFRKSRGTHLIEQGLPIANVVELMWGNQNTKQIGTYIRINPVEQDRILLKHAGAITEEENKKQERRVSGAMCPKCHTQNAPTTRYCSSCGTGLTIDTQEEDITMKNLIEQHPEIFKVVAEMLAGMGKK